MTARTTRRFRPSSTTTRLSATRLPSSQPPDYHTGAIANYLYGANAKYLYGANAKYFYGANAKYTYTPARSPTNEASHTFHIPHACNLSRATTSAAYLSLKVHLDLLPSDQRSSNQPSLQDLL
jgi:hypothetical protein